MPTYEVTFNETVTRVYIVEADNAEEAESLENILQEKTYPGEDMVHIETEKIED